MLEPAKLSWMSLTASTSMPGSRDVGAEPVERQHRRREGDLAADLRDAEGVGDRLQHRPTPRVRRLPPAASIFSCAVALKPWARTVSFLEISPRAEDLDRVGALREARPRAASRESPRRPASKRSLEVGEVDRLGAASGTARTASTSSCAGRAACASACGSGSGRPRRPTLRLAPARAPAPLWPRPEVLPMPEPCPRPTRLRRLARARLRRQVVQADLLGGRPAIRSPRRPRPGARPRAASPRSCGRVGALDRRRRSAQPERAQRLALVRLGARGGPDLRDLRRSAISEPLGLRLVGPRLAASACRLSAAASRGVRARGLLAARSVAATARVRGCSASPLGRRLRPPWRSSPSTCSTVRPAQLGDVLGAAQPQQAVHRRLHQVDRVLGADALRQDVADAAQLEHRAHAAAGDHAGSLAGRAQDDVPGAEAADDACA